MRMFDLHGRQRNKSVSKYLIDWNKKSRSKLQKKAKDFFKTHWKAHVVYEEFPVYGTRMKVDILNATIKVAVEVNGPQHSSFNKFFHDNSRAKYLRSIKRDWEKAKWLEKNGYQLIELEESDLEKLSKSYIEKVFGITI
tara:strand:+ start:1033 stop:1449 length:417 start_codon:yes stop_codon:yes gene_type:complete